MLLKNIILNFIVTIIIKVNYCYLVFEFLKIVHNFIKRKYE